MHAQEPYGTIFSPVERGRRRSLQQRDLCMQMVAAIVSVAVENDGARGYTSFVLLIIELNSVVWVGYYSDRNAGNAIQELQVSNRSVIHMQHRENAAKFLTAE